MSRARGAEFEEQALRFLQRQRLRLVARNVNYRGGELDLVMRDYDGTLVFVEVRARSGMGFGGAGASVDRGKRERIIGAARQYLARLRGPEPRCRFDVIAFDGGRLSWYRAAFDSLETRPNDGG
jgi:putative endonuclease